MYKRVNSIALAIFVTAAGVSAASAADLAPPPAPVPEIRPSVTDWTGPYIGGTVGGTCMDTMMVHHNTVEDGTDANNDGVLLDPGEWDGTSVTHQVRGPYDTNGCGFTGGVVAGFNYQFDSFIIGLEGEWSWGGRTADHYTPYEHDRYSIDWMASIRPRIGYLANDDTLFYITGGPAWLRGELKDVNSGTAFKNTHFGYAVGGGIEHALTQNLHVRAEYLYSSYKTKTYGPYCATCDLDGDPETAKVSVRQKMDDIHTFRLGVTWNFPVTTW